MVDEVFKGASNLFDKVKNVKSVSVSNLGSEELEKLHEDFVKIGSQIDFTISLLENSVSQGRDFTDTAVLDAIENLKKSDVNESILDRGTVTPEDAEKYIKAIEKFTNSLENLTGKISINLGNLTEQLISVLRDSRVSDTYKESLIKEYQNSLEKVEFQSDSLEQLKEVTKESYKQGSESSEKVEIILEQIKEETADEWKDYEIKELNDNFEEFVITNDKLNKTLEEKDSKGVTTKESFLNNPELIAKGKNLKTGAISHLAGAFGLSPVIDMIGADKISDAFSIKSMKSLYGKAKGIKGGISEAGGLGNYLKGVTGEKLQSIDSPVLQGLLNKTSAGSKFKKFLNPDKEAIKNNEEVAETAIESIKEVTDESVDSISDKVKNIQTNIIGDSDGGSGGLLSILKSPEGIAGLLAGAVAITGTSIGAYRSVKQDEEIYDEKDKEDLGVSRVLNFAKKGIGLVSSMGVSGFTDLATDKFTKMVLGEDAVTPSELDDRAVKMLELSIKDVDNKEERIQKELQAIYGTGVVKEQSLLQPKLSDSVLGKTKIQNSSFKGYGLDTSTLDIPKKVTVEPESTPQIDLKRMNEVLYKKESSVTDISDTSLKKFAGIVSAIAGGSKQEVPKQNESAIRSSQTDFEVAMFNRVLFD